MADQPLVCICIPTYNAADTVYETLVSILAQTYRNLVVHISDNASTDDTLKVIETLGDPRVHIHCHAENIGGEGNFNRCIQLAEGKYTALFHADDLYEPEMVERQVAFLEAHTEAGAVFTEARTIDENGNVFGEIKFPVGLGSFDTLYNFETIFKAVLLHSNFFICPSVMARTEVYQHEIKSWRGDLFKSSADLDVWLRIAQRHKIGLLPDPLMRYRISANQFSAKVRLQTERSDFFLVTEHYLDQEIVRKILGKYDLENYARLNRRDRVMRAVNFILSGNAEGARSLLYDIFSWDALKAGLQTKRGLGVLVAGIYSKMLLLFEQVKFGQLTLGYLKRVLRK
jgi:glycosyltransferase involved in cell wall biosynthesis